MFYFTLGISFQYDALCQLHNRILPDQKDVEICKSGK